MSADEITQRHLQRLRVRGAPAIIPGTGGSVGQYEAQETWRQTVRALVTPLDKHVTAARLEEAFGRLAAAAEAQQLSPVEDPLFALKGNPAVDPPHQWEYEAVLPIRGVAREPQAEGAPMISRVEGGMHIVTVTPRGLSDLKNVYVYLFGKFMPSKKQQLMRPYLLHRVAVGLEGAGGSPSTMGPRAAPTPGLLRSPSDRASGAGSPRHATSDDALTVEVYVPAVLSIKPVVTPDEGDAA